MASTHQFGGTWTDDKLERLRKYLPAYLNIFAANPRAARLRTTYVDAFAGTGYRTESRPECGPMFAEEELLYDKEAEDFQKGSARIALDMKPPFGRYLFVEKKSEYVRELEALRQHFPTLASRIEIRQGEANSVLCDWCGQVDWRSNRAVVFLDPYGMEVQWDTIVTIAQTGGIDLWLLFPLGQAVNRLLTRDGPPEGPWADSLTRIFGTPTWRETFYRQTRQMNLFGEEEEKVQKEATFESIGRFFLERLRSVFPHVAGNPLYLRNSRNVPIYLLCFAAANERGGPTAVKIAESILGK